ncbi:hypothetical protein B566_EDAN010650 [Ephemera danica]|nr:hypothetical protein B566_EDAN010650 [Ephemera danica]
MEHDMTGGGGDSGASQHYAPTPVAVFFHRLPHINILLRRVNATFNPSNEAYIEALGLYASVPAAWLILTLFVLLVYLLTRCCDRNPRRKRSITPLKWVLGFFAILCCGAVAVGLYGNDDVHNGLVQVLASAANMEELLNAVKNETLQAERTLQRQVQPLLMTLQSRVSAMTSGNATIRGLVLATVAGMQGNATVALRSTKNVSGPLSGLSLETLLFVIHTGEIIRWPVTMAVLSLLLVFCFILLFGVVRHARGALIAFSVFGLFAVITSYLMSSLYLTTAVALSDFCVNPDQFVEREVSGNALSIQRELAHYYVRCDGAVSNPLGPRLSNGQRAVDGLVAGLSRAATLLPSLSHDLRIDDLVSAVNVSERLLSGLEAKLSCHSLHRHYQHALHGVCDLSLFGLTFMLCSSAAAGLLFTLLVWIDSHTWIYIRKRPEYLQVDEQDPFLATPAAGSHHHHHLGGTAPASAAAVTSTVGRRSQGSYGSTGYFRPRHSRTHTPPPTPPYPGTLYVVLSLS